MVPANMKARPCSRHIARQTTPWLPYKRVAAKLSSNFVATTDGKSLLQTSLNIPTAHQYRVT